MIPFQMEIFRVGTWTDSQGTAREWTPEQLDAIAASYNPDLAQAPIVIGHPQENGPAYGWITGLSRTNGTLLAAGEMAPEMKQFVDAGLWKKRSASFYPPDSASNPAPGSWYLRHVGFLGATPPAVAGLADLKFVGALLAAPEITEIEFVGAIHESPSKTGGDTAPKKQEETAMKFSELWDRVTGAVKKEISPDTEIESAVTSTASFSAADIEAAKKAAAEAATALATANFAEQQAKAERDRTIAAHKSEVKTYLEGKLAQGKIIPAWMKLGLVEFCSGLDPVTTVDFGAEGGGKKTNWEFMRGLIEGLPQVVNFGEFAKREQTDNSEISPVQKKVNEQLGVTDEQHKKTHGRQAA